MSCILVLQESIGEIFRCPKRMMLPHSCDVVVVDKEETDLLARQLQTVVIAAKSLET